MPNIEKISSIISYFQNVNSSDFKYLSEIDKKTLLEGLTAIRNQKDCSNQALEMIKNLHNPEADDTFYISDHSIKKRIQSFFHKKISSSSIQKSINRLLHDELSEMQTVLKTYKPFISKDQFQCIQSSLQHFQKVIQKRGLSHHPILDGQEKVLFTLLEQFSKAKEEGAIFDFLNNAFNKQDLNPNEKLTRIQNSLLIDSIPEVRIKFYENDEITSLPLEDLEKNDPDGVLRLHQSYKEILVKNSSFFKSLFDSSFKESDSDQITLGEIERKDFIAVLKLLAQNESPQAQLDQNAQVNQTIPDEDAIQIYSIINRYDISKLLPVVEPHIIKIIHAFSPKNPEDLTLAINLYKTMNPLSSQAEELFGRFFANVLGEVKSEPQRKAIIEVFDQIEVRNLIFSPQRHKSDLKDIDQIKSLKVLKLEGRHFDNGLFSYLKNAHLEDLFLDNCHLNFNHLHKFHSFNKLHLNVRDLKVTSFNKLMKQAAKGLPLTTVETNRFCNDEYAIRLVASPDYVSQIIFDINPTKNNKIGEMVKFIDSKGIIKYEGYISFNDNYGSWSYRFQGEGKYIFPNGDIYEGNWKSNYMEGKGTMTLSNGDVIEAEWKDNAISGIASVKFANGDVYEGTLNKQKPSGKGKFIFVDGSSYEGKLKDGLAEGQGKKIFANGDIYNGNWQENKRQGQGTMIYANGDRYIGNWQDDKRVGEGKLKYSDGRIYRGPFLNNEPHGRGILEFADKRIYIGDFFQGEMHGHGKVQKANGILIYDGDFKAGKPVTRLKSFFSEILKKASKNALYHTESHKVIYDEFQYGFSVLPLSEKDQLIREWTYNQQEFQEKMKTYEKENRGLTDQEIRTIFSRYMNEEIPDHIELEDEAEKK